MRTSGPDCPREIGLPSSFRENQWLSGLSPIWRTGQDQFPFPGGRPRIYNVVGYICETDTFASNRAISEIHPGDILCFKNAGAYCFSMSSNYNSRFRPAEVMLYEGKDFLIRQRETIEDLLKNQILQDF